MNKRAIYIICINLTGDGINFLAPINRSDPKSVKNLMDYQYKDLKNIVLSKA